MASVPSAANHSASSRITAAGWPRIAPLVCGVVFSCVTMGVAAATAVSLSVRTWLDPALVPVHGWRIAFVIGGLGGVLSFVLRRPLDESPEFERMRSLASRQPFREQVREEQAVEAARACEHGTAGEHVRGVRGNVLKARS